jgi:hypothetical protein
LNDAQHLSFDYNGHTFPLYIGADSVFYAYDPNHHLDGPHGILPGATPETVIGADIKHTQLNGLGFSTAGNIAMQTGTLALNFVPVVGPILSAISAVVSPMIATMFGGNDPTPRATLENNVLSLRQQIVTYNNAMGVADKMPTLPTGHTYAHNSPALPVVLELWPANITVGDPNHWSCDWNGVHCPGCGNIRKCFYAAINKMRPIAQELAGKAQQALITQQVSAAVSASGVAPGASGQTAPGVGPAPGGYGYYPSDTGAVGAPSPANAASISSMGMFLSAAPLLLAGVAILLDLNRGGTRALRRK